MSVTPPRPGSTEPISSSASPVSQESVTDPNQDESVEIYETSLPEDPATGLSDEASYTPNVDVNPVPETGARSEDEQPVTTSVPKELSPVSPVPLHVPEPSKIPLLLDPALSRTIPNEEQIPSDIGSALSDPSLAGSGVTEEGSNETTGDITLLDATTAAVPAINGVDSNGQPVYQPELTSQQTVSTNVQNSLPDGISLGLDAADTTMTGMTTIPPQLAVEPPSSLEMRNNDALSEPVSATQSLNLQALLASMASQTKAVVENANIAQRIDVSAGVMANGQPSVANASPPMFSPTSSLQSLKSSHHSTPLAQGVVSISHPTNLRHPLPENPTNVPFSDTDEGEITFSPEEERAYESFLAVERDYVAKGEWGRFPVGSRLFIGNLSADRVNKRDVYHIFAKHGKLAQISIKQAYGFVQFFDVSSCTKALRQEQGTPLRGRQMHLEISKPQRGSRSGDQVNARVGTNRRSRSPEEPMSPRNRGSSYRGQGYGDRDRESRNSRDNGARGRDEYRPVGERRMSSPRPQYARERDDYYGRDYNRDRSRSPRGRYRSQSPPHRSSFDRPRPQPSQPSQVIDALIVVFDELDPAYIKYVDGTFRDRRLRTDVLHITPRINLESYIKEQVVQGCKAFVFLTRATQQASKVSIQIFKGNSGSAGQYDEYDMIPADSAAELVRRAVGSQPQPQPQYNGHSQNSYPAQQPPAYHGQPHSAYVSTNQPIYPINNPQPAQLAQAGLTGILQNLDPATLQTLLAQLQQQQQPSNPYMQAAQQLQKPADLSALLGAAAGLQQQQQQTYGSLAAGIDYQNPALVGLLGSLNPHPPRNNGAVQQQPQPNQQVQNIMNQLTGHWPTGR
ncbi:uncharacterized protein DFL_006288 [Arthrobotrys flagrans]|uniref:RRM domain-containing protein n=1 Tax=Arthrobotrys flagrans TaxID=97331 RepID=A0A437A0L3_ARTFL|nr:hypothetical protein DFL_006288 [Arthrobotrys flagrans]